MTPGTLKYFKFSGTAKRSEYWAVYIILLLVIFITSFAHQVSSNLGSVVSLVIFLPMVSVFVATVVRRVRDAGLNPWWAGAMIIPAVGTIAFIVFGCIKSVEQETTDD